MHSNYDFNYILTLRPSLIGRLVMKAHEKEIEKAAWEQYLTVYPNMDEQSFVSFADYKKKIMVKPEKKTQKTNAEIMDELMPLVRR